MPYECLLLPTGMEDAGYSGARRAQTTAAQVNESTAADEPRCKAVCKLVRADCHSARGRRRSQEPGQLGHSLDWGTCQPKTQYPRSAWSERRGDSVLRPEKRKFRMQVSSVVYEKNAQS